MLSEDGGVVADDAPSGDPTDDATDVYWKRHGNSADTVGDGALDGDPAKNTMEKREVKDADNVVGSYCEGKGDTTHADGERAPTHRATSPRPGGTRSWCTEQFYSP